MHDREGEQPCREDAAELAGCVSLVEAPREVASDGPVPVVVEQGAVGSGQLGRHIAGDAWAGLVARADEQRRPGAVVADTGCSQCGIPLECQGLGFGVAVEGAEEAAFVVVEAERRLEQPHPVLR